MVSEHERATASLAAAKRSLAPQLSSLSLGNSSISWRRSSVPISSTGPLVAQAGNVTEYGEAALIGPTSLKDQLVEDLRQVRSTVPRMILNSCGVANQECQGSVRPTLLRLSGAAKPRPAADACYVSQSYFAASRGKSLPRSSSSQLSPAGSLAALGLPGGSSLPVTDS